jgi:DNA modification methylase
MMIDLRQGDCLELDPDYFKIAEQRINEVLSKLSVEYA